LGVSVHGPVEVMLQPQATEEDEKRQQIKMCIVVCVSKKGIKEPIEM
jgi:hypothetical protein